MLLIWYYLIIILSRPLHFFLTSEKRAIAGVFEEKVIPKRRKLTISGITSFNLHINRRRFSQILSQTKQNQILEGL